jgi:hypothetical protein
LLTTTERTLYIQTRSGKGFLVKESGEITAVNGDEDLGLMIGLLHRPSHVLKLLPAIFSMFEDLPAEELLRQLALCMDEPNSWLVITEVNRETLVWPDSEAVNGLRVQRRKALAAQAS